MMVISIILGAVEGPEQTGKETLGTGDQSTNWDCPFHSYV